MASSVFFKFKSQREPTRVEFDGTGISVFELKREIINKSGLGDGTDFDLSIYTDDNSEEYDDDTTIIPRSTTVIARRQPALKPGAGRAARYVSGKMPVTAKNAGRREQASKASTTKPSNSAINQMSNALTEEEKMAAMFAAQTEQWSAQQEEMSHQTPVFKPGAKRPANVPDHDPPNGYICYRCGQKGHWIQLCPTNDDPEFDNRPRVKRTTGIPRSFLQKVDKSTILAQTEGDESKRPSGIMVNAEGDFVIAEPDKASWEQFQAKTKSSSNSKETGSEDKDVLERGLACPIDKKLLIEPMKTPCCEKSFCNDCITNALIESDFVCPACQTEGVLIDDLVPDEEITKKVQGYVKERETAKTPPASPSKDTVEDKVEVKTEGGKPEVQSESDTGGDKLPSITGDDALEKAANSPTGEKTGTPTKQQDDSKPPTGPASDSKNASAVEESTKSEDAKSDDSKPKKRPADDLLENPKVPKGPRAMQQQQQHQQQQQNQMPNMMNGMPNMGMNNMMFGNMGGMMPNMMMPNMGMGMGMGMPNMMGMPMMGMQGMQGFQGMNGGFNGMNGWDMSGMNGMNGMGGGGNMMGMNGGGNMNGGIPTGPRMSNNAHNNMNGQDPRHNFTAPGQDEDAYFRKPVNPHRHQNKGRKPRPSDYREL